MIKDIALLLPIPAALVLFGTTRAPVAAASVLLGGMLLLPAIHNFDAAGLPPMDRERIAALSAIVACALARPRRLRPPRESLRYLFFPALLIVGSIFTTLHNRDPLYYGPVVIPGMSSDDLMSIVSSQILDFAIPFFLGVALVRSGRDLREVLLVTAVAALAYSLPILYEARMSPRLHYIVYGFTQHSWQQVWRLGGWRPMVFMTHGLALAMFVCTSCLAATTLWKARVSFLGLAPGAVVSYLIVVLLVCRSLGSLLFGATLLPLLAWARPRIQMRTLALLAAVVALYPMLKLTDAVPSDAFVSAVSLIDEGRAASLEFRFEHEGRLFSKARERIWFGWGAWGRNSLYSPLNGRKIAISDGYWIIQTGRFGVVGFVGLFGMLLAPVWAGQRRFRLLASPQDRVLVAGLAAIVVANTTDMIPNAFPNHFTVFLSGALASVVPGMLELQRRAARRDRGAASGRPARAHPVAARAARASTPAARSPRSGQPRYSRGESAAGSSRTPRELPDEGARADDRPRARGRRRTRGRSGR